MEEISGMDALSFMIASATPEQRTAFERMLTAVGRGVPLGAAITSELQQTLPEFTARYREFHSTVQLSPDSHDVRVELPDEIPVTSDPASISPEEMQALMGKLCSKLHSCRK